MKKRNWILSMCVVLCFMAAFFLLICSGDTATASGTKVIPKGSAVIAFPNLGKQPTDPHYFTGSPEWPMKFALNQRLLYLDPDGKIMPGLAESWEIDPDQLTWTFHLTKMAKFHSGNPFTAHDYVYSFYKVVKDERCHPSALGAPRKLYEKVWATDDYTLKVKTREPFATMLAEQSHSSVNTLPDAVDSKYIEKVGDEAFKKSPSLTGWYKLVEVKLGDYTKLEAFDDAYPHAPYTKELKFTIVPEAATRLAMVKTGQADVMTDVLGPAIPEAKATKGIRTVSAKEVDILEIIQSDYYYPDEPSPILDKRVRHALAYAIDRQAIVDKLYYGEGTEQKIPSCVGWMFGADQSIKGYPYNPEKSKALLKEAGYAKGFNIQLTARPWHMDLAMAVAGFWEDIGIKVELKGIEPGTYLREAPAKKLRGSWVTTVPTMPPDIAIRYSEYYLAEGLMWGWCKDPLINKKTADMLATMDTKEREKKAKALTRLVAEELPSRIPVICRNAVYAIGPRVEELIPGRSSYWCFAHLLKMKD